MVRKVASDIQSHGWMNVLAVHSCAPETKVAIGLGAVQELAGTVATEVVNVSPEEVMPSAARLERT